MTLDDPDGTKFFNSLRNAAVAPDVSRIVGESRRRQSRRRFRQVAASIGLVALGLLAFGFMLVNERPSQIATDATVPLSNGTDGGAQEGLVNPDTAVAPTGDAEGLAGRAAELDQLFEGTDWRIVQRSGFDTSPIDGFVRFFSLEGNPILELNTEPCQSGGLVAIEWNSAGFEVVVLPEDQLSVRLATQGADCVPEDDLLGLLNVNMDDPAKNQFDVEIIASDNVNIHRGDQTLTLAPAGSILSSSPATTGSPSTTEAVTTTTTR